MHYYRIERAGVGHAIALEAVPLLLIAAPHEHPQWGVYASRSALAEHPGITPVDGTLAAIIDDALNCPPALALARQDMLDLVAEDPDRDAFLAAWKRALVDRLSAAPLAGHALRTARGDFGPDLLRGERYWVLDARPGDGRAQVRWVSRDYWVYSASAEWFEWSD